MRRRAGPDERAYPRPEPQEILAELERQRTRFAAFHDGIHRGRQVRFLQDEMPAKWAAALEIDRRSHIHSRIGHNMVQRIVALATRNPPRYQVPTAGGSEREEDRARKQERWLNNLWPNIERSKAVRRALIDNQVGDGLGVLEIYRTHSYADLDTARYDGESDRAYLRRTEELYMAAASPYGVRVVDPAAYYWVEDGNHEDPVCMAWIEEELPEPVVYNALLRRLGETGLRDWMAMRLTGVSGDSAYRRRSTSISTVRSVRYYDRRWFVYLLDGVPVEGPTEHRFGFVPVIHYEGMTSGSPILHERYQGAFWGLHEMESTLNWLLTLQVDNAFVLSKPKIAITQPQPLPGGLPMPSVPSEPVDFSGGKVPRLRPGEVPVNLTETFRGHDVQPLVNQLMQLIQLSGLNPIAQGESPGSDPAGYAVNALQAAAQANYEVLLDNAARGDADLGNKLRRLIRDDLRQPWYLTAPLRRGQRGTAWAGLGPDDITDVPCIVTIDALADVNRIALQQTLRQANKEGYISRERVQEAYAVDDPELENDRILMDAAEAELARLALEEAKAIVYGRQQQATGQGPGLVDQFGNPLSTEQGMPRAAGATPAPPQPPSVGGAATQGSQAPFGERGGPAAMPGQTARAGQDQGRRPGVLA